MKTSVQDDAGKSAQWNESFTLPNIAKEIACGGSLILEALDQDTMSNDWIGATQPQPYSELVIT